MIAKCYGFSARSSVHKIIDLLDQPDPIQDLLSRDIIGEEQLHFLSRIKDLDAKVKVAKPAADEGGQSK